MRTRRLRSAPYSQSLEFSLFFVFSDLLRLRNWVSNFRWMLIDNEPDWADWNAAGIRPDRTPAHKRFPSIYSCGVGTPKCLGLWRDWVRQAWQLDLMRCWKGVLEETGRGEWMRDSCVVCVCALRESQRAFSSRALSCEVPRG